MPDKNTVIDNILNVLNDHATDYYNGDRIGSLAFGPDEEINFGKYMPKYQVLEGDYSTLEKSFGLNFARDKTFLAEIYCYTIRDDVGSNTNYKNRQLINQCLKDVELTIGSYVGSITGAHLQEVGMQAPVRFYVDKNFYFSSLPILFAWRE